MRIKQLSIHSTILAGVAMMTLLGAAAPVDGSIAPLTPSDGSALAAKTVSVAKAGYQAAPVPNPDVDAPPDTTKPDTTVGPRFLRPKALFQGDGYSYASSEQGTLEGRRLAAAGLGLNVPLSDPK